MAYNYYPFQGGYYTPAYQPVVQQPVQQAQTVQPQNYSPTMPQSSIIWISGEQEAQMYPIAPNNAVALWEKNGKTIYLKSADATGKPTITVYDLVERNAAVPSRPEPVEEYAKQSDLAAVATIVSTIKSDIDTMKSDMYGIAGKKKAVKKVESDDE